VTIGLRSAHALDDFVASLTNSPTETKFWGSIQRTLEKASAHTAACSSRAPDCTSLTGLSGELNRIALSAYLQGFLSLATEQCERQLGVLAASPCGCARVSELQPWVNLARLARARQDRAALAEAAAGLAGALEIAAAVDPGTLPHDLAEGLGNGSMLGAAQHVETIETAKLEWLACEYAACERLVAPLAPHSGVAMELNVRCMLEGRRWGEAVGLAATWAFRFPWLRPYAAMALLGGGADDAAARVVASLGQESPLPLLRLCIELSFAGWDDEARAAGERMLAGSLAEGNEVASLLAAAFLSRHGDPPDNRREAVERLLSGSWHHPAVSMYEAVIGFERGDAVLREARATTIAAGEQTLEAMLEHGRHAP